MATLVIKDPGQIVSPQPAVLRGPGLAAPVVRRGESILVEDGIIAAIAPFAELEQRAARDNALIIEAGGRAVVPGLIDCHSHLVFAGSRADDFALRCAGVGYEEIAARGGGIGLTVAATRAASKGELKDIARRRLDQALRQGTTTMEVKTGYGLDPQSEMKMLEVIADLNSEQPVDLVPTFLGAHAVPKGMTKEAYLGDLKAMLPEAAQIARFCDVFCEQGYFTPAESRDILETARSHGMLPRLHANQFHSIGCIEAAVALGAVSVDHLEVLTDGEILRLAATDIACVMLPGVSFFLDIPFTPGRAIIDAGCIPAVASDFNPGSNPCLSLQLAMSLACLRSGMQVGEALACVTGNAGHALRLEQVGCIEESWQADLLILDCADYRDMVYFYGDNHVQTVIKNGLVV
jgi:imidazolonepropionase